METSVTSDGFYLRVCPSPHARALVGVDFGSSPAHKGVDELRFPRVGHAEHSHADAPLLILGHLSVLVENDGAALLAAVIFLRS